MRYRCLGANFMKNVCTSQLHPVNNVVCKVVQPWKQCCQQGCLTMKTMLSTRAFNHENNVVNKVQPWKQCCQQGRSTMKTMLSTRLFSHENNVVNNVIQPWKQCCQQGCSTMKPMLSTRLFNHENNVVAALFNHQYCYNLLTTLSEEPSSEQVCSINIVFFCSKICEQSLLLHQCWTTLLKQQRSTTLFSNIVQPW